MLLLCASDSSYMLDYVACYKFLYVCMYVCMIHQWTKIVWQQSAQNVNKVRLGAYAGYNLRNGPSCLKEICEFF